MAGPAAEARVALTQREPTYRTKNDCSGNVFHVDKSEWICRGNSAAALMGVTSDGVSRLGPNWYQAALGRRYISVFTVAWGNYVIETSR
jgi:hypothetical protein